MEVFIFTSVAVLVFFCDGVAGFGRYCFVAFMETEYCDYGCCDIESSTFYKQCCPFSLSTGAIVGIVIGSVIFVVVTVIIVCCVCKNHSKFSRKSALPQQTVGYTATTCGPGQQQPLMQQQGQHYMYPTATAGYAPAPQYQQGQVPPTGYQQPPPPSGYQQSPVGYQQPLAGYEQPPQAQLPGGYIEPPPQRAPSPYPVKPSQQPFVEPSAPPPSYEDLLRKDKH